jgi:ABC-type multidrug transport system ATPase subunit
MPDMDIRAITFSTWYHYLVAPFAFIHGLRILSLSSVPSWGHFWSVTHHDMPLGAFCIMGTTVLVHLAVIYVDEVLPRKDQLSLKRSPLYPLRDLVGIFSRIGRNRAARVAAAQAAHIKPVRSPPQYVAPGQAPPVIDQDVLTERQALADGKVSDLVPLRVANLRKIYPDGKVAVQDVAFHIEHNEVFCLLGVNGAGKSTAIACMCGLLPMTAGGVSVCGVDVGSDPLRATRAIGMSPQDDVFWPDLTVGVTLRVFATMKGVAAKETADTAKAVARFVGLQHEFNKKACALSGGMRRRLTMAIALIGAPKMLALDEITAGVDPATKRLIFRAVQAAKASRGVLITTHDLDEASIVSDRLAIMQAGTLRCIGTLAHLKARFGLHYKVQIQPNSALSLTASTSRVTPAAPASGLDSELDADDSDFALAADACVQAGFAEPELVDVDAATGSRSYHLPPHCDLEALFSALLASKEAGQIESFSVVFSTLRDLFLAIAAEGARETEAEALLV